MSYFFIFGLTIILFGFTLSLARFINCLIMVENLNVLLLFTCVLSQSSEMRMFFLVLMVIFTVEITLCLVVLTRLWRSSSLVDSVGL
uniref:NADH dehydrogenase subunit 4L n=1 Tax=Dollfustrema vaneyi TaxID=438518 RepID=A0AAU7N3P1_9TREM